MAKSAPKVVRKFRGSALELIIACLIIIQNGSKRLAELVVKNTTWKDPFFPDLEKALDAISKKYLGVDTAANLRNATIALTKIVENATNDLSLINVQIKENFKSDPVKRNEYLNVLGFNDYYADVAKKSQLAILSLLFQLAKNLTTEIQNELIKKGIAPDTISNLLSYTQNLQDANVKQENFKIARPADTAAATTAYNDIYAQVISIAKIAAKILATNPTTAPFVNEFSYAHILATVKSEQGTAKPKKSAKTTTSPSNTANTNTSTPPNSSITSLSGGGH